jgi:DNA-binding NtrC family response regulator
MMQENQISQSRPSAGLGQLTRRSVDRRIEILKEVTLWLLNQLELLSNTDQIDNREGGFSLSEEVRRFEVELITNALFRTHGNQKKAAKLLGVNNTTLNSKMKRYRISSHFTGLPISSLPETGASSPATTNGKH